MNSGHPQVEQKPFVPWLEIAKRKFVGAMIHNSGQFAVAVMDHKNVYLFDDFFETVDFMAGHPQYRLYDLSETPVHKTNLVAGNIKSQSDWEDRQWERRQKREAQAQGSR